MGMTKEEFMDRYWKDKERKERQKETIVKDYFCERSNKIRKQRFIKNKYKMASVSNS